MTTDQTWVHQFSDEILTARFGAETFVRGLRYANEGRVKKIDGGDGAGQMMISARVQGKRPYTVVLHHSGPDCAGKLFTHCSCPMGTGCKHSVAVLLVLRRRNQTELIPSWRRVLARVADEGKPAVAASPLALEFTRTADDELELRPLMRGKSKRWVKTGVSWQALENDYHDKFGNSHRNALRAVYAMAPISPYYRYQAPSKISLSEMKGAVWGALRDAAAAGVTLVGGAGTPPVVLANEPARLSLNLDQVGTDLQVDARVIQGDQMVEGPVTLVGDPLHGVVMFGKSETILTPLDHPVTQAQRVLLDNRQPLHVPEEDIPSFVSDYLPTLRRTFTSVEASGFELPEISGPTLQLEVTFLPDRATKLHWSVAYRVGDQTRTVGILPGLDDPTGRDQDAEMALLATLPNPAPWLVEPTVSGHRPARETVLTGRASINFVTHVLPVLEQLPGLEVILVGEVQNYRESTADPVVTVTVGERDSADWFDLGVEVTIDDETVPFSELFRALSLDQDHLVLSSGTWFDLDRPELEQLRTLIAEAADLTDPEQPGFRLRAEQAGLWQELVDLGVVAEQSAAWRTAVSGLLDPDAAPPTPIPPDVQATLRHYQESGYRWLNLLLSNGLGGILADDMGLGKTLQVLTLLAGMYARGELDRPALVIAPTSVLANWAKEAARFTPLLRVTVLDRTGAKRGTPLPEAIEGAHLVVTSYTLLRLDDADFAELNWSVVVLDEAQFVKNRQSKVYGAVRRLPARVKFAITGTPLENNLMDLWSLLSITAPGLFPNPERFAEQYRRPIESGSDSTALPRLLRRIRPFMLRRTKEAVITELPPKQEQVVPVTLTPAHRRTYDKHLQAERRKVLGLVGDIDQNRIAILRALTKLRQLSLSPALIDPASPVSSAKIDTLVELLHEVAAEGHRALVFSQFTSFLALVRERLTREGIAHQYLDGRTRNREARIEAFRAGTDPAFLISLKAGGFGLTLTEADYVFILDPWWNPAAELQAVDRTHRIGQERQVMVYRLVSADTIEDKVVALQQRKRDLFDSVVGAGQNNAPAPLSADEIRGLLEI